jgi:putative photosynthetic complex assembly protein
MKLTDKVPRSAEGLGGQAMGRDTHSSMPPSAQDLRWTSKAPPLLPPRGKGHDHRFPRGVLIGAGLLVTFAIAAAAFGKITDIGTVRDNPGAPVQIRDIRFDQQPGGRVTVLDARLGEVIADFRSGEGGFVTGSLRGLNHERNKHSADPNAPYRLILWEDGRLSLSDTATGQRYYLNAFGIDNARAFAALFRKRDAPGDEVIVHGSAIEVPYGEVQQFDRRATILRATWPERLWTRMTGDFEFMELCEFSFSEEVKL